MQWVSPETNQGSLIAVWTFLKAKSYGPAYP